MKNWAVAAVAISILALTLACGDDDDEVSGTPTASATANPSPTHAATPTPTISHVCKENTDPATEEQVQVTSPEPGDEVTSPMTVTGLIAAFEAQFNIALKDAGGATIVEKPAMSSEGQTLATFSVDVEFNVTERTPACLWVFDYSPRDGQPSMIHQVPVILLP